MCYILYLLSSILYNIECILTILYNIECILTMWKYYEEFDKILREDVLLRIIGIISTQG